MSFANNIHILLCSSNKLFATLCVTSPLVEHLPCVDDPCMQSRTTPCFMALQVGRQVHQSISQTPATRERSTQFFFRGGQRQKKC